MGKFRPKCVLKNIGDFDGRQLEKTQLPESNKTNCRLARQDLIGKTRGIYAQFTVENNRAMSSQLGEANS